MTDLTSASMLIISFEDAGYLFPPLAGEGAPRVSEERMRGFFAN